MFLKRWVPVSDILLAVVIVALLVERVLGDRRHDKELRYLLNMIQARNTPELIALTKADNPPVVKDPVNVPEPQIPVGL